MNKLSKILSGAALLACAAILINGCNSTTSPTGGPSTNVMVIGATNSSITVSWTRDGGDGASDTIVVKNGVSGGPSVGTAIVTGSQGTVTGLTTDVLYTITVNSTNGVSSPITYTIGEAPSNFRVRSNSATSISAKWSRGTGDMSLDTLIAMNGTTVVSTQTTSDSSATVTGLNEGTPYTITLHTGNSSVNLSGMTWMTAERTNGIKVYETSDPNAGDPSGLLLQSGASGGVKSESLSGAANADFALQTVAGIPSGVSLVSGKVLHGNWNNTGVDPNPNYIVGGLDSAFRSSDYSAELAIASGTNGVNSYDIPGTALTGSRVLICQTASGNLALVEVVPDASTGLLYSVDGNGHKYVTLNVSYQTAADQPYAARARSRNYGEAIAPRTSAK